MLAKGLDPARSSPAVCGQGGDKAGTSAGSDGWTLRWREMHGRSYALSAAQVQAFETEPVPG